MSTESLGHQMSQARNEDTSDPEKGAVELALVLSHTHTLMGFSAKLCFLST